MVLDEEVNKINDKFESHFYDSLIIYGEPFNNPLQEVKLIDLNRENLKKCQEEC